MFQRTRILCFCPDLVTEEYRVRVLDEEVCINDPALRIWSQDFNPVTCNLLSATDQVSDKAGTGVCSFKFSAEVIGTGLAFVPCFFVLLNSVFFVINKGGAQTLHKSLVNTYLTVHVFYFKLILLRGFTITPIVAFQR